MNMTGGLPPLRIQLRNLSKSEIYAPPTVYANICGEAADEIEKLRGELKRVSGHLETWAADHPDERTADIDAAIFCSRQLLNR